MYMLRHRLNIKKTIQYGRPFSYLYQFVHNNHRREMPPNQISFSNAGSLLGRYLAERLDVDWSTRSKFGVNVYKRGYKKKDDLSAFLIPSL